MRATFNITPEKARCGPSWNVPTCWGEETHRNRKHSLGSSGAGGAPSTLSEADWSGDGRPDKKEPPLGWGVRGGGTAARWASLSVGGA